MVVAVLEDTVQTKKVDTVDMEVEAIVALAVISTDTTN